MTPAQQEERKKAAEAWLKTTRPDLSCPACSGTDYEFKNFVLLPVPGPHGKVDYSAEMISAAAFSCKSCPHLWLFSTEAMNLP